MDSDELNDGGGGRDNVKTYVVTGRNRKEGTNDRIHDTNNYALDTQGIRIQ